MQNTVFEKSSPFVREIAVKRRIIVSSCAYRGGTKEIIVQQVDRIRGFSFLARLSLGYRLKYD